MQRVFLLRKGLAHFVRMQTGMQVSLEIHHPGSTSLVFASDLTV
jgi:hypothetical protein